MQLAKDFKGVLGIPNKTLKKERIRRRAQLFKSLI
jgi:hypothetical protein